MDDGHIEIELTPVEPTRRHVGGPSDHGPLVTPPSTGVPDEPLPRERRNLLVTATVVGMGALLLGWVLGRSGGDGPAATPAPSTSERPAQVQPTTSVRPGLGALDTLPPVTDAAPIETTLPFVPIRPTVTTTLPDPPEAASVELDPRLAGLDVQIVGLDGGRPHVQELDLATGTLTDYGLITGDTWEVIAGDDWIVMPVYNGLDSYVIRHDGTIDRIDLGNDSVYGVPETETFWVFPEPYQPGERTLVEVDLDGAPTGREVALPSDAWPYSADPAGGVFVELGGTWFSIGNDTVETIGHGDLIGADRHRVVLYQCDADLDCGLSRVDRRTGEEVLVGRAEGFDGLSLTPSRWWGAAINTALSPDGSRLVMGVQPSDGSYALLLVDFDSGVVAQIDQREFGPPAAIWLNDDIVVFIDDSQQARAYDIPSGESFPVIDGPSAPDWSNLTRRPAAPVG